MVSHLTGELRGFVLHWLPADPARILDIGCGEGESTHWLAERGYDPFGVDPDAANGPRFARTRIQDFEATEPFDAGLAIRSLHHVGGLDEAVESIAAALRPRSRLVVIEYAIEAVDERALRWSEERELATPVAAHSAHDVARLAEVREALKRRFRLLADEPAPYLAREAGRPELEPDELEAIAAGKLAAAGARLAFERD